AVGTSSTQQVTVTDQDPHVAAALANALAADLVQTRRELHGYDQTSPIGKQISSVQSSIAQLDSELKAVNSALEVASPVDVPRLSSLMTSLVNERSGLVQQEDQLLSMRSPIVVDPATVPTQPVSGRRYLDMALGLLLGLALGVGL